MLQGKTVDRVGRPLRTLAPVLLLVASACGTEDGTVTTSAGDDVAPSRMEARFTVTATCQGLADARGRELVAGLPPVTVDTPSDSTTVATASTIVPCNASYDGDERYVLAPGETTLEGVVVLATNDPERRVLRTLAFADAVDVSETALARREMIESAAEVAYLPVRIPADGARRTRGAVVGLDLDDLDFPSGDRTRFLYVDMEIVNPTIDTVAASPTVRIEAGTTADPYPYLLGVSPIASGTGAVDFALSSPGSPGDVAFYALHAETADPVGLSCIDGEADLKLVILRNEGSGSGFSCRFDDPTTDPASLVYLIVSDYFDDESRGAFAYLSKPRAAESRGTLRQENLR